MGIQQEAKGRMTQLTTGVHLITVPEKGVVMITDKDNKPVLSKNGEMGCRFRFMNDKGEIFDHDFWLGGKSQFLFDEFCKAAKIDQTVEKIRNEAKGKRCWIAIKEVWKINGTDVVNDPLTGEPDLSYQIFKFIPFDDSGKKPIVPGDPELNNGQALEPFVDYVDISGAEVTAPPVKEEKKEEDNWEDF